MATVQLDRPLTYDDLAQMPDDLNRYEIINGELFVSPSPKRGHQEVALSLLELVAPYVRRRGLGRMYFAPVDVRLSPYTVVEPDLLFLRHDRLDMYHESGVVEGPPDLVVEISSPPSQKTDVVTKAALYASAGVPEYWLVDPEHKTFRLQVLKEGIYREAAPVDGRLHSTMIDGLVIDPNALFAGLA